MKKKLLFPILVFAMVNTKAQNVGINTPAPATSLDINGGFRVQPKTIVLIAAFITIANNESNILLQAGYAGDFSITINAPQTGQRLIIDNQTGYIGAIEQDEIIEQGMNEFIYSLGKWKIANKAVNSWKLTGNAGTTVDNFIGTSDAQPIRFRTHGNRNAGFLDNVRYNYHVGNGLPTSLSYTGSRNVSLGYLSSSNLEAGSDNVSLGFYSLFSNKAGTDNVAIGTWAMRFNKTGSGNVAIGQYALQRDTSANGNVAIGPQALQFNDSRNGNTAIGSAALQYNTNTGSVGSSQGELNTAIGAYALNKNLRGSGAVAIGAYAAFRDTAAEGIVAIGRGALFNNIGRPDNLAIGDSALYHNSNGVVFTLPRANFNLAIGRKALFNNTTGLANLAIGNNSLEENRDGISNIAIGLRALRNNITSNNIALGHDAIRALTDGIYNIGIGNGALFNLTEGQYNIGMGVGSGTVRIGDRNTLFWSTNSNSGPPSEGSYDNVIIGHKVVGQLNGSKNIFIGNEVGGTNSSYNNVGIGDSVLAGNTDGYSNVAIGTKALARNTITSNLVAIGDSALFNNGVGATSSQAIRNVAIGSKALLNNTTGVQNTAIGFEALKSTMQGGGNTAVGAFALTSSNGTLSIGNVAVGGVALANSTSGQANTAIGSGALQFNGTGIGNVAIGNAAGANEAGSNKLYIENSNANKDNALIYGDFFADSLQLNAKTVVRNNAVVRGFTKLGGYEVDVPSIKMKKIIIPAGPAVNANANYPFGGGITDSKVLGIEVLMRYDASTSKIPPGYIDTPGYEYNVQVQFNGVTIINKVGNSANIGGKPITVVITYEE